MFDNTLYILREIFNFNISSSKCASQGKEKEKDNWSN